MSASSTNTEEVHALAALPAVISQFLKVNVL